ncbi:hypothetical protein K4902_00570 [Streptomyces lateritius]|nr:hypothetical protein [Streptomyces lateritius]
MHLELCPACDTGDIERTAAGNLLRWFTEGGGRDPSRAEEGAALVLQWTLECMATHGLLWMAGSPEQPFCMVK